MPLYRSFAADSDLDPEISDQVLGAVLATMNAGRRAGYAGRLAAFADAHRERLERLYAYLRWRNATAVQQVRHLRGKGAQDRPAEEGQGADARRPPREERPSVGRSARRASVPVRWAVPGRATAISGAAEQQERGGRGGRAHGPRGQVLPRPGGWSSSRRSASCGR
ncbi:hypothetical protein AB0K92_22340 [Streptomyces sp. NPDC052687]|uniref:hypothetical protein n=1 Tax=Streptomyces sp. NPDC052687 TaxID=3154759 RepID=UPI00342EE81B